MIPFLPQHTVMWPHWMSEPKEVVGGIWPVILSVLNVHLFSFFLHQVFRTLVTAHLWYD